MNDYYKILNLNGRNINRRELTDTQVKIAYEKIQLQIEHMKARAKDAKEMEQIQKLEAKLQEAYHALETREKRDKYNEMLEQASKEEIPQEKVATSRKPVFNMPKRAVAEKISKINPDKLGAKSEREYIKRIEETQKEPQRTETKKELQFMPIGRVKKANNNTRRGTKVKDMEAGEGLRYLAIQRGEEGDER